MDEVVRKPRLIRLPETNITLEKLPPIRAAQEVDLPQTNPSTPLVPVAPMEAEQPCGLVGLLYIFSRQLPPAPPGKVIPRGALKKDREPKFVPYEPYKAAVTHLVEPVKRRRPGNVVVDKGVEEVCDQERLGLEVHHAEAHHDERDAQIQRFKDELAEKEKQIRIQTQVWMYQQCPMAHPYLSHLQINTEVKRLLVASVGEDIEAKVDYLTQDKARLSADIRQYASKISRDFEEKEQLSVESNLWKSKFLACR